MPKKKEIYSFLALIFSSAFLAGLLSFLFEILTNLASETISVIAVGMAVGIAIFIDETIFGERDLVKRLAYSLFVGLSAGLGIFIFNFVI